MEHHLRYPLISILKSIYSHEGLWIISSSSVTFMTMSSQDCRKSRRRVCLFGLSADPPTGRGGHVGIVQALLRDKTFDEIRVLPVYRHTYEVRRIRFDLWWYDLSLPLVSFPRFRTPLVLYLIESMHFCFSFHYRLVKTDASGNFRRSLSHVPLGISRDGNSYRWWISFVAS